MAGLRSEDSHQKAAPKLPTAIKSPLVRAWVVFGVGYYRNGCLRRQLLHGAVPASRRRDVSPVFKVKSKRHRTKCDHAAAREHSLGNIDGHHQQCGAGGHGQAECPGQCRCLDFSLTQGPRTQMMVCIVHTTRRARPRHTRSRWQCRVSAHARQSACSHWRMPWQTPAHSTGSR